MKILIVEDNDLNLKLFRDLLTAHGYDTFETKEGMEALVIEDAARGIDAQGSLAAAWTKMTSVGVKRIKSSDLA